MYSYCSTSYKTKDIAYNTYIDEFPTGNLPLSIDEVRNFLKLPATPAQTELLTLLIDSAARQAESLSDRIFIQRNIKTFRNCFTDIIELKKSPFISLTSFQYLVNNVLVDVPSDLYYVEISNDYSSILLDDQKCYPQDIDRRAQSIEINFIAGYATDETLIPKDLKLAFLNHISHLYENRGDCDDYVALTDFSNISIPSNSRAVYNQYKIPKIY
jgi:uncharacterized phiE125 gp8 family phage protein